MPTDWIASQSPSVWLHQVGSPYFICRRWRLNPVPRYAATVYTIILWGNDRISETTTDALNFSWAQWLRRKIYIWCLNFEADGEITIEVETLVVINACHQCTFLWKHHDGSSKDDDQTREISRTQKLLTKQTGKHLTITPLKPEILNPSSLISLHTSCGFSLLFSFPFLHRGGR